MITTMSESAETVNEQAETLDEGPPPAFASFDFDPEETLTLYGAVRSYVQLMAQQDQAEMTLRAAKLMALVRPMAVKAAQMFPQGG